MAAFQVSRKVDYALRAMVHLAGVEQGEGCTLGSIATQTGVSSQFLAKIVGELMHRGLVRSRRGPRGGYALARPASEVSFTEVIEAVEGPIALNTCVGGLDECDCPLLPGCGMMPVWQEAQERIINVLSKTTLADIQLRCGSSVAMAPIMQPCEGGNVDVARRERVA